MPRLVLQAIGAVLPAALAVALSPFPVIGVVLILAGTHGRRNGPLFAAGWVAGLVVVTVLVVAVFGGADDSGSTSAVAADWLRILFGAGLVSGGIRKWWKRAPVDEVEAVPGWMASLDDASASRALGLGVLLSAANPKNFVLTAAAATSMVEAGVHGTDLVVAVAVFVALASVTVVGAVVVRLVGGQWGVSLLESVRHFMVANSVVITVIVLVILGAKILSDGLSGLRAPGG